MICDEIGASDDIGSIGIGCILYIAGGDYYSDGIANDADSNYCLAQCNCYPQKLIVCHIPVLWALMIGPRYISRNI